MIIYEVKTKLDNDTFLGSRKNEAGSFAPTIFFQDSSEVDTATLVLTEDQATIFANLLFGLLRVPAGSTEVDYNNNVDIAGGKKLGTRQNDATGNVKQLYLLNNVGTEIATITMSVTELRQFKFSVQQMNRTPQDDP